MAGGRGGKRQSRRTSGLVRDEDGASSSNNASSSRKPSRREQRAIKSERLAADIDDALLATGYSVYAGAVKRSKQARKAKKSTQPKDTQAGGGGSSSAADARQRAQAAGSSSNTQVPSKPGRKEPVSSGSSRGGHQNGGAKPSMRPRPPTWRDSHRGLGYAAMKTSEVDLELESVGGCMYTAKPKFQNEYRIVGPKSILEQYFVRFVKGMVLGQGDDEVADEVSEQDPRAASPSATNSRASSVPIEDPDPATLWEFHPTQEVEIEDDTEREDEAPGQNIDDAEIDTVDDLSESLEPTPMVFSPAGEATLPDSTSDLSNFLHQMNLAAPDTGLSLRCEEVDHSPDVAARKGSPGPMAEAPVSAVTGGLGGLPPHGSTPPPKEDDFDDLFIVDKTPALDMSSLSPSSHGMVQISSEVLGASRISLGFTTAVEVDLPALLLPESPSPEVANNLDEYNLSDYDDEPLHHMFQGAGVRNGVLDQEMSEGIEEDESLSNDGSECDIDSDEDEDKNSDDDDETDESSSSADSTSFDRIGEDSDEEDAIVRDYLANISDEDDDPFLSEHVLRWAEGASRRAQEFDPFADPKGAFLASVAKLEKSGIKVKRKSKRPKGSGKIAGDTYGMAPQVLRKAKSKNAVNVDFEGINKVIKKFLQEPYEQTQLPAMPKYSRKIVNQMAKCYQLNTKAIGSKKTKRVLLVKTRGTDYPRGVLRKRLDALRCECFEETWGRGSGGPGKAKAKKSGDGGRVKKSAAATDMTPRAAHGYVVGQGAQPIADDNVGHRLLRALGWTPGASIGTPDQRGITDPLQAVVRGKRRGLGA